jgi:uroporphyrinogen-III synthase
MLERHGVKVDACPGSEFRRMLELRRFAALAGRGVLLVKGRGGRELLRDTLRARAPTYSNSTCTVVRSSHRPRPQRRSCTLRWPTRVRWSSVPVLKYCSPAKEIVAGDDAARLRSRTLLVPGPRVAAAAVRLGWTGPVVAAAAAEDEAMLAALTGLAAGSKPPA